MGAVIPFPIRKPPLKVKAMESAMNGVRLARHFDAKGRPDLSRRAVDVVDTAGRRAFGKSQRYSGGAVTVGKREVAPIPKGPLKKAPTIARTGGAQPRAALLKPAALLGVRIGKLYAETRPANAHELARLRSDHPVMSRIRRKHYGKGFAMATDEDGGYFYDSGTAPKLRAKKVSTFSNAVSVPSGVTKRARDYDPEDARQRRLGGAITLTGAGGAALAGRGGVSIARSVHSQADQNLVAGLKTKVVQPGTSARVRSLLNAVADRKATVIHHSAAGRLAAGAGLVAVSAGLARRSHTRRYM